MRIIYVINSLAIGGAEFSLLKLVNKLKSNNELIIISLLNNSSYISENIEKEGVKVICLGLNYKNFIIKFFKLIGIFRKEKPDIVHTWLYMSDLIGGICAKIALVPRIYWGIHNTYLHRDKVPFLTRFVVNLNGFLSYFIPNKVISCSHLAIDIHRKKRYNKNKFIFIPNGVDLDDANFYKKIDNSKLISELGIKEDDFVIGYIARYDVLKNHKGFLLACQKISKYHLNRNFKILLVGEGVKSENKEIQDLLIKYDLLENVILLGYRSDVSRIINILDISVLFSWGEAFPNVIIESMIYSKPVLASDVGDCKFIIGDCGSIVESGNTEALAQELSNYINMDKNSLKELGEKAKNRVLTHFTMDIVAQNHLDCYYL